MPPFNNIPIIFEGSRGIHQFSILLHNLNIGTGFGMNISIIFQYGKG